MSDTVWRSPRNNSILAPCCCKAECPSWVKTGHWGTSAVSPLYPNKRTSTDATGMSAKCQLQTFRAPFESSQCIRQSVLQAL